MKTNSLLLGAAVLMLATACSNDEVVQVAEKGAAIGFTSFANNSTRADYGSSNLPENLRVYGVATFAGSTVKVFYDKGNGDTSNLVERTGDALNYTWTYSPLQYWIPEATYSFAAVAPAGAATVDQGIGTSNGGIKTISFTNDGETDLLYCNAENPSKEGKVSLNLGHLLSRVRFQFGSELADNYYIEVTDIQISDAVKDAEYDLTAENPVWSSVGTDATTLSFRCDNYANVNSPSVSTHQYLIPTGAKEYNASFKIKLFYKDNESENYTASDVEKTFSVKLPNNIAYASNNSYTFKTTIKAENIGLEPIEFSVDVTNWPNDDSWTDASFETPKVTTE